MWQNLARIEFFFAEQNTQEGRFAGSIPTDEPDFDVLDQRRIGSIKQHLIAVTLVDTLDLQQYSHIFSSFLNLVTLRRY